MADPVYRFRHYERAENLEPYDIVSTRNGGFIEVWEVEHTTERNGGSLVLVTPRGDNHSRIVFEGGEHIDFLRPDTIPEQ